jgi:hypothetical protein
MDPSIIGNVDSLYALLGLGIVVIAVLILDQRRRAERTTTVALAEASAAGQETTSNGHSVSVNYVKRIVAENCRDCKRMETMEERLDKMTDRLDQIYKLLVERV